LLLIIIISSFAQLKDCADMLNDFIADLRFGARIFLRNPGFTVVVVITLALGIGANTAIFSFVDAVLVRPLPYTQPERLAVVLSAETGRTGPSKLFDSYSDFEEWKRSSNSFEQLEACTWARPGATLKWQGTPQRVLSVPATAGFFSLLGTPAAQGRTFEEDDLRNGCAVVLSHRFWSSHLGGSPDVIGSTISLDDKPCAIIGVMPEDFQFYPKQTDLWMLITPDSSFAREPLVLVVGRLKHGVSNNTSQAELVMLHQRVIDAAPSGSWLSHVEPIVDPLRDDFTWLAGRNLDRSLLLLFGAVGFILLIACINVANLLLGRGSQRQKELAIRAALGSGRSRLVRQLLTESLLLSLSSAALGAGLAGAGVRYFRAANPVELPPGNIVVVDFRALIFAALLAVSTILLFGLLPALKVSKLDLNEVLKASGRSPTRGVLSHRFGKLLVISEVTLSIVLLSGASLLIESAVRLRSSDLGFRTHQLLSARVDLPEKDYSSSQQRFKFYDKLAAALESLPRVQGLAMASGFPLTGSGNNALAVSGTAASSTGGIGDVTMEAVSYDYFNVMDIPLIDGRAFDSRDRDESQQVAIVNEALVREYFPGENAIGKQIKLGEASGKAPWLTIVGVVGDVKRTIVYKEMDFIIPPSVYRPTSQSAGNSMAIMLRMDNGQPTSGGYLQSIVSGLDSNVPVSDIKTMEERVSDFLSYPRFRAVLLGLFAAVALALAAIGIYGVLSQSVLQRTPEIGIRVALGAQRRDIIGLVLRQAMTLVFAGVTLGVVASVLLMRLISSLLYNTSPTEPMTLAVNSVLLVGVALLACYIPAKRATTVDPMVALKCE
jgi:predicted permease